MAVNTVFSPFPLFTDADGHPLEAGYIWIGVEGLNPETNPVAIFWDEEKTQPAAQPVRTINGYPSRDGTPSALYTAGSYGITVRDRRRELVFTDLSAGYRIILTIDRFFDDITALLADTVPTYPVGTILNTRAEGFAYEVVTTGEDLTTAGGVKLQVLPDSDGARNVDAFGAVGDGVTSDADAIEKAFAVGGEIAFSLKTYATDRAINLESNIVLAGNGWGSVIKMTTTNTTPLIADGKTNITIQNMGFVGAASTVSTGAIYLVDTDYVTIRNCEFQGFSAKGVWCQGNAGSTDFVTVDGCYFHDWTATVVQDSCSIAFLARTKYCTAFNNICYDGGWHGILILDTAADAGNTVIGHKVIGNNIGPHLAYGVAAYENGGGEGWHLIEGNHITTISGGSVLGGTAGCGIYLQGGGQLRVANNRIFRACQTTTVETLTPAGIGVNGGGLTGEITITGNQIEESGWYGIAVFSNTAGGRITIDGNTITNCVKTGVYLKNSAGVTISNNIIEQDGTATGPTIQTFDTGSTQRNSVSILGNSCFGRFSPVMSILHLDAFNISGNTIKIVSGAAVLGVNVQSSGFGAISGNTIDGVVSDANMLTVSNVTATSITGNTIRNSNPASRNLISMNGTCTGTFMDASNYLSEPVNITNTSTGGNVEIRRVGAPPVKNWAVGDRTINSAPAIGSPVAWTCTAAGSPGTWASEGSL